MSDGLTLRVYDVEDEDMHVVLCDECATWIRDAYQIKVEEVIAGVFRITVCQGCGKD